MASDLTGYGTSACVDCAACRERDAEIARLRLALEATEALNVDYGRRWDAASAEVERLRECEGIARGAAGDYAGQIAVLSSRLQKAAAEVERLTAQLDAARVWCKDMIDAPGWNDHGKGVDYAARKVLRLLGGDA